MQARSLRGLGVLAVACLVFGCDRLRDVKRCRALAEGVNHSLDAVEALSRAPQGKVDYAKIASEYDALAKSLDGYDGGTPVMTRTVAEFTGVVRSTARQASALANSLAAGNKASANLAKHELERLTRQEKLLVQRLDEQCRPK